MLSCLSPRRPCCGPNAAVTFDRPRDQRVEGVRQIARDRGRMRDQRHALALERLPQFRVGEQAVDAEFHSALAPSSRSSTAKQAAMWKSGLPGGMGERPVGLGAVLLLDHRGQAHRAAGSRNSSDRRVERSQQCCPRIECIGLAPSIECRAMPSR